VAKKKLDLFPACLKAFEYISKYLLTFGKYRAIIFHVCPLKTRNSIQPLCFDIDPHSAPVTPLFLTLSSKTGGGGPSFPALALSRPIREASPLLSLFLAPICEVALFSPRAKHISFPFNGFRTLFRNTRGSMGSSRQMLFCELPGASAVAWRAARSCLSLLQFHLHTA